MKVKQIVVIVMLLTSMGLSAQENADIQQIRKWYYATKKQMEESKKHTEKTLLLCTVLEKNACHNKGAFYEKQEFWHGGSSEEEATLKMVIQKNENWYLEYFYHDNELVFFFLKDDYNEHRFYFKNGELIKKIAGTKVDEGVYLPTVEDIQHKGSFLMRQWMSDFCSSPYD